MKSIVNTITVRAEITTKTKRYVLGLQEATVSLAVNAIPEIEMTCAPTDAVDVKPLSPMVVKPSLFDFRDMYKDLAEAAESMDCTGDVDIVLEGDDKDSLSLKGWVLASVGMSGAGATSAPSMAIVLQHPICRLTKVGSIYETPKTDPTNELNKDLESAKNPLDVIEKVYKSKRDRTEYWKGPSDLPRKFREQLGKGIYDPKKYLAWKPEDGNGIFLGVGGEGDYGGQKMKMAQAIGSIVKSTTGDSSTWDMILGMSGHVMTTITQDQDCNYTSDRLVMEAIRPWKTSSLTLKEDRCEWTELPGINPLRICGVMSRKLGPYANNVNLGYLRNGNQLIKDPVCDILYVPDGISPDTSSGRILKVSAPYVLEAAFARDAPSGDSLSTGYNRMDVARADGYNATILKYCRAVYESTVASMVQARAGLVISFHLDGKLVLPGNTCEFMARRHGESKRSQLYYGYITNVVHRISARAGNTTIVSMSYVRPGKSLMVGTAEAVKYGAENAAYK